MTAPLAMKGRYMAKITITEALSELNLIKKKIEKKQAAVLDSLTRLDHMPDPFEDIGGSRAFVKIELQAIDDLRRQFVKIRSEIAKINTTTDVSVMGSTMTINEWLNWRREQATESRDFAYSVANKVKSAMDQHANRPPLVKDDQGNIRVINIIANVDYYKCLEKQQTISDMMEKLDGQLSLKNATTMIDV